MPLVLLALLVVESTLYFSPNAVPRGIFHPGSGSTQLRLPEVYITLALVARLIARGKPTRIGLPAGLWLAFGAWMAVGAVEGGLYHNQFSQNIYEAKAIWYVVGAYALAAGVPVRRYLDSGDLFKLGSLCVGCATLLDLMTIGHVSININVPLLPLQSFGSIGNEGAALFFAIGTMCFLARMASGPVRLRDVAALIPLIVCVVLADERAVLLNLAVVAAVIVIAALHRTPARHRSAFSCPVRASGSHTARCRRGLHHDHGHTGRRRPAAGQGAARLELRRALPWRGKGRIGPGSPEPGQ